MKHFYKMVFPILFIMLGKLNLHAQSSQIVGRPTLVSDVVRNICLPNFNLTNMILDATPSSWELRWYTNPNHTGSPIADPTQVADGTYYAFYYNTTTQEFSAASDPLVTERQDCTKPFSPSNMPKFYPLSLTEDNFGAGNLTAKVEAGTICSVTASNIAKLINSDVSDYINDLSCDRTYFVKHNSGTFPAGSFAGFKVSKSEITLSNYAVEIKLYNNGTVVQTKVLNAANINEGIHGSFPVEATSAYLGFTSNVAFNELSISFSGNGTPFVYHAVVANYPQTQLKPNVITPLTINNFAVTAGGKINGLCIGCGISNVENIILPTADLSTLVTVLGVGGKLTTSVKSHSQVFEAGTFAGYAVSTPGLLPLSLISNITLTTYLDGVQQETISGTNLVTLNSSLLTGSLNATALGLITTKPWNEIAYSRTTAVDLLTTDNIHYAFVQKFEDLNVAIPINTPVSLTAPDFPVSINPERTTTSQLCVNCQVQNPNNIISDFEGDYASIQMPVAALGATASIAVKQNLGKIDAGSFVGFEVENITALNLNLLESFKIVALKNGVEVSSASGSSQLVGLSLASSEVGGKNIIGFVTPVEADELQLIVQGGLVGVSLGETRVYRAIVTQFDTPTIVCDTEYSLTAPAMPVTLSMSGTGTEGAVCAGTTIQNPEALISADTTDAVLITTIANVLCNASVGVKAYNTLFPKRSTIDFIVEAPNNFLQLDLLNFMVVSAYKNGVLVSQSSAANLLNLELLGLFGQNSRYKVSHLVTEGNYDEVKITFGGLASVAGTYRVYGATVNTRGAVDSELGINCCTVTGFTPQFISVEDISACTDEYFNLNSQLATTCPTGSEIRWYTSNVNIAGQTPIANPTAVGLGTYYAVCYDAVVNCYSNVSQALEIALDGCCPEISVVTSAGPTTCGGVNGSFTIDGLRPDTTGYEIEYTFNGNLIKVSNVTASNTGTYTVSGLAEGLYTNIRVIHAVQCSEGSNVIDSLQLIAPLAPSAPLTASATNSNICVGDNTTLTATCETGSTVAWYLDAALTTPLVGNSVNPTVTTSYYAVCETSGCKSSATEVIITVNPNPTTPVVNNSLTICEGTVATLAGTCATGNLAWFSDAALLVPVLNPSPVTTTTYYGVCISGSCKSLAATTTVTVNPRTAMPTNLQATPSNILAGETTTLSATCSSGTVVWYADAAKTQVISNVVTPSVSTTYYAACGTGECAQVASITINVAAQQFILALNASKAPGQTSLVSVGQNATLRATVTNRGNVNATDVQVVAYIPAGLTLNDPNWTLNGNTATLNTNIPLVAAGTTQYVDIILNVAEGTLPSFAVNFEISAANGGTNMYSTFDNNPTNDALAITSPAYGNPLLSNINGTTEMDYDQVILNVCTTGNCLASRARRVK